MPIDNRDYVQGKDTKRYKQWESEKGVSEEEVKEEWRRGRGYLPERKPHTPSIPQNEKKQHKLQSEEKQHKLLWLGLVVAIIFLVIAIIIRYI